MNCYLLPNKFKRIGIWMAVPFFILFVLYLLGIIDDDITAFNIPVFAIAGECMDDATRNYFTTGTNNIVDEIIMVGLLVSLCFIALSKEQDEDEMTATIRMKSFVWSMWVTAILLGLGIILIYGISFISFAALALFAIFFLYIAKFNIEMCKIRRAEK